MPDRLNSSVFGLLDRLMDRQAQSSSPVRRLIVAYSGGLDSSVLLHLLHGFVNGLAESEKRPSLHALHINHNLQVQSGQWADHCTKQAKKYGLTVHVMNAVVKKDGGKSLEEAAREARYLLFEQFVGEGDVLCLAHHQDDQAETLLLRLLRGSGPLGLSAMREQSTLASAKLLRPLLAVSRDRLADYARKHHLSWIDDPSNQDLSFDRNYLRHEIIPRLKSRWPGVNKTLSRVTEINQATVTLLDEVAEQDYRDIAQGQALNIAALQALSEPRLDNLLRYWLQKQGALLPSRHNLQRIRNELLSVQGSGEALVRWPGADVRAYQNRLYFVTNLPAVDLTDSVSWHFDGAPAALMLGEGRGLLYCEKSQSGGLAAAVLKQASQRGDLHIRWRQGGERCHPTGRGHSQRLKKLLQEYQVPPWLRDTFPLLYSADQCLAVPGLWVEKDYVAQAGDEAYVLSWSFYTEFQHQAKHAP